MSKSWIPPQGEYISTDGIVTDNIGTTLTSKLASIDSSLAAVVPVSRGGTGATNMTTARTNLGIDPTWNNFRIGGNINIQSNSGTTSSSGYTTNVSFRNTFSNTPYVWVTAQGSSTSNLFELRPGDITTSGFKVYAIKTSTGGTLSAANSVPFRWVAIGQR